jgi:hypothetical protein
MKNLLRPCLALSTVGLLLIGFGGCRQIIGVEDPVACSSDEGCDPGPNEPCLQGECVQGECVYSTRPDGPVEGCSACEAGELVAFEDEGEPCYTGPEGTQDVGACAPGTWVCTDGGAPTCEGQVLPSDEVCGGAGTGVDEDCDGTTDVGGVGCTCEIGESIDCYEGPAGTEDVGVCSAGTSSCEAGPDGNTFGPCEGQTLPQSFDSCVTADDEDCDSTSPTCTCDHAISVGFGTTAEEYGGAVSTQADSGSIWVFAEFTGASWTIGADTLVSDGNQDMALIELDAQGNAIRAVAFGGVSSDYVEDIAVVEDGIWISGILGQGSSESFGSGATLTSVNTDGFLVKLDFDLNVVSKRKIGANDNDTLRAMAKTPDGGVVITGTFQGSVDFGCAQNLVTDGSFDFYVASYGPDGACKWAKNFGTATSSDAVYGIAVGANGRVLVPGSTDSALDFGGGPLVHADYDPFIAVFDEDGNHVLSRVFPGAGYDTAAVGAIAPDGTLWIAGSVTAGLDFDGALGNELTTVGAQPDLFVARFSATGEYLGSIGFDSTAGFAPTITDLVSGPDGSAVVSIRTASAITFDQLYTPAFAASTTRLFARSSSAQPRPTSSKGSTSTTRPTCTRRAASARAPSTWAAARSPTPAGPTCSW